MTDPNAIENNPFKELGEIPEKKYHDGYKISSIYIPMRDGIKIATTICLPKGLSSSEKLPTLLVQTRYWRAMELRIPFRWILDDVISSTPNPEIYTSRGYAIVYTDVRGTGASEGTRPHPWYVDEIKDGADVVDWIISQPWSDGNVVSNGISYPGICSEFFALNNHPAVKAIMPGHAMWDAYIDLAFPGGCYDWKFMEIWSFFGKNLDKNNPKVFKQLLPVVWLIAKGVKPVDSDKDLKILIGALNQHKSNKYVYEMTLDKNYRDEPLPDGTKIIDTCIYPHKEELEKTRVPILAWCSWLDSGYVDVIIHRFANLDNPQIAILGDWNHGASYPANQFFPERVKVTPSPRERINAWINFFDKCVKGNSIQGKTLYYYTMVEEKWKKTIIWPPKGQKMQRWYLSENNSLSRTLPRIKSGADSYEINFRATTGRNNRWWTLLGLPIIYENRKKIDEKLLTYTSAPLEEDLEITGHCIVSIYFSSTHEDNAVYVYLEDIDEKGNVTYITDGQLRVIHRKISTDKPPYKIFIPYHTYNEENAQPLTPGEIAELKFGLHATSVVIRKNHRIRIAIAGHDKDTFYRYPSKGRPTIKIERNEKFASYIDLPIIKKEI